MRPITPRLIMKSEEPRFNKWHILAAAVLAAGIVAGCPKFIKKVHHESKLPETKPHHAQVAIPPIAQVYKNDYRTLESRFGIDSEPIQATLCSESGNTHYSNYRTNKVKIGRDGEIGVSQLLPMSLPTYLKELAVLHSVVKRRGVRSLTEDQQRAYIAVRFFLANYFNLNDLSRAYTANTRPAAKFRRVTNRRLLEEMHEDPIEDARLGYMHWLFDDVSIRKTCRRLHVPYSPLMTDAAYKMGRQGFLRVLSRYKGDWVEHLSRETRARVAKTSRYTERLRLLASVGYRS